MRTIKDVIKAIPQLQNQKYELSAMGQYGEGEYYQFYDGSLVMEENDLEIYSCATEQSWFWEDYAANTKEEGVLAILDKGTSWKSQTEDFFVEELYSNELGLWDLSETIKEGSLIDGVVQSFGDSSITISSELSHVKDINIDFEDLFEDCYSKTEKVFVMINAGNEEDALIEIAFGLGMANTDENIIFAIEENADQLMSAPKEGADVSKENMKKLLTLVESGNTESFVQAIDLVVALDAPNAIDTLMSTLNVESVVEHMTRARTIIEEVDPDCWNGAFTNGTLIPDQIQERIGENIDTEKPYTMVFAFLGEDNVREYTYINENDINWNICKDLKVDVEVFEDTPIVYDTKFKKIYKMKDWYIALT